jgi:hypothetical protein
MTRRADCISGALGLAFLGAAIALFCGCGAPPPPTLVPVAGKVLVNGIAVKSGTVQFRADAERGNKTMDIPVGAIRNDGSYELMTNERPGAPRGWYRGIVIGDNFKVSDPPPSSIWPKIPEGAMPKPFVNERYLYFKQTDLFVEVVDSPEAEAYVLKLKP